MFLDGRLIRILRLRWAARQSLRELFLENQPSSLVIMVAAMQEPATDGTRSPSFEYCANKQQATEATSENCWIFLVLKTNYPTNKQTNRKTPSL